MAYGFVYVLKNEIMPDIYKIGCTEKSPMQRAADLSNTSLPFPYEVVCYGEIENPMIIERELHSLYKEKRVASNREFFKLEYSDLDSLAYLIKEHCTNFVECEALNIMQWSYSQKFGKDSKNEANS